MTNDNMEMMETRIAEENALEYQQMDKTFNMLAKLKRKSGSVVKLMSKEIKTFPRYTKTSKT